MQSKNKLHAASMNTNVADTSHAYKVTNHQFYNVAEAKDKPVFVITIIMLSQQYSDGLPIPVLPVTRPDVE